MRPLVVLKTAYSPGSEGRGISGTAALGAAFGAALGAAALGGAVEAPCLLGGENCDGQRNRDQREALHRPTPNFAVANGCTTSSAPDSTRTDPVCAASSLLTPRVSP